jgi:hypothetical protein
VCGDATRNIEPMCQTRPDCISIDENVDMAAAKAITDQHNITIGGNIPLTTVMLLGTQQDNMKFTVALEGFELNTVGSQDEIWVPAGKTTQLRVPCVLGMFEAFMSLGVVGGMDLQKMGKKPWDMLEKWWTTAPDFSFPVEVRNGSAVFKADGITKVAAFKAKYP